jgi:hypothetical protein
MQYVAYLSADTSQTEIRLPKRPIGGFIAEEWSATTG